jgi:hypothetical protein
MNNDVLKLEPRTVEVLRSFAKINPGIVIRPGNVIRTINYGRTVFGKVVVPQTFDREIAIADLSRVFSVFHASSTITIEGERLAIRDASTGGTFSFPLTKPENITAAPPANEPRFPSDVDTRFDLPQDKLQVIQKLAKKHRVGFSLVIVTGAGGKVMLTATSLHHARRQDPPEQAAFEFCIGETDQEFRVILPMENLQTLMPGDYSVKVSYRVSAGGRLNGVPHFVAPDMDYWMTMEAADSIPVNRELLRQSEEAKEAAARTREQEMAQSREQQMDLTEMIKKLSGDDLVRVRAFIQDLDTHDKAA